MSQIINLNNSELVPPSRSVSPASVTSIESFNNESWFFDRTPDYDYARNIVNNDIIDYTYYNNYNNYINMIYNEINNGIIPIPNMRNQSEQQFKFNIGIAFQTLEISEEMQNCCICLEKRQKDEICELNCNHNFCGFCVKDILSKNNNIRRPNSPVYRENIKNIKTKKKEIQNTLDEYCIRLI